MLVLYNIDRLEETLSVKCLILYLKENILGFEEKGAIFQKAQSKTKKKSEAKKKTCTKCKRYLRIFLLSWWAANLTG